jgi:uncharacterized RDD family membrane protein YckC
MPDHLQDDLLDFDDYKDPSDWDYAEFYQRLGAALVDLFIIAIPFSFLFYFLPTERLNITITRIIMTWLYFALLESGPQQATIGKKMLGIMVCDEQGNRLSFITATGRHFARYLCVITLLIGYFIMLFNSKKQALHDIISGTLVLKNENA